jgi:hypothetical protein
LHIFYAHAILYGMGNLMKKNLVFVAVLFCFLAFCLIIFSCDSGSGGGSGTHTVRYLISGPQIVADNVIYHNENGNYDQLTNVPIPWEKTMTVQGRLITLSCSAQFDNTSGSTYTAKIFVDGKEFKTASSTSTSINVVGVYN